MARFSVYSNVSHFLVSNVPSKFYRLDLLVFFLNSKDQQKVSILEFCCCCVVSRRSLPSFFKHISWNVDQNFFPVISTPNKSKKYFSCSYNMLMSGHQTSIFKKLRFEEKMVSHQLEKVRWLEKLSQRAIFDHSKF